jgi:hypothetical protein
VQSHAGPASHPPSAETRAACAAAKTIEFARQTCGKTWPRHLSAIEWQEPNHAGYKFHQVVIYIILPVNWTTFTAFMRTFCVVLITFLSGKGRDELTACH